MFVDVTKRSEVADINTNSYYVTSRLHFKKIKIMKKLLDNNKFLRILSLVLLVLLLFSLFGCSSKLAPTKKRFIIITNDTPVEMYQSIAPAVVAAIIAGGTALAGAGINAFANRQQWNAQNEYNSPAEQMSRYRAAGLNPNLIYGSGQASAGNAGAIAPFQANPVSTNDLLQAANAISVIKNTEANARKANAEAVGAELNNALHSTQLQYYGSSMALENRLKAANLDYISGKTDQLGYQNAVYQAQAQNIIENALYTKQNREVFQPALIAISRQNAATAANRLNWDMNAFNPLNVMRKHQGNLLGKDYQYYESDRLFNRRNKSLNTATNAARGLFDFGKFFGTGSRRTYTEFDTHYGYYP